jgi:hypothetical protein
VTSFGCMAWNVLTDAPQHTAWIKEDEVTDAPGPVFRDAHSDTEALADALCFDVLMPMIHVLDEQMHEEVFRVLLDKELLQQETAVAAMEVRQVF